MQEHEYIYTLEIEVRDYELDSEGIVNNARYLHYLEMTRHAFCRDLGYSFASMTAEGIVPVVRRIEADYLTPLRSGDVMLSRLWIERQGAKFVFHQDIFNKATTEAALRATVAIVCIENGKISRGERLAKIFGKWL